MTQKEFKAYVLKEAKALMAKELQQEQSSTAKAEETLESISPESIAKLAQEMKAINETLMVNNPLIAENNIIDDIVGESESRKLRTPLGREYDIEMKDTLNETMTNYNDQKHLNHNKESMNETWDRLTNYKRFSDEG